MSVINVDDYVDVYIHYHASHMAHMAENASLFFVPLRNTILDDIGNSAMAQQAKASIINNKNHNSASQALDFADELANRNLVQSTLETIAQNLNQTIDERLASNAIDSYYKQVLSFSGLLENGEPDLRHVRDFLNLLVDALNMTGGYNQRFINILRSFGSSVRGKQIRFNPGGATLVSNSQLQTISKIEDALNRAVARYNSGGRRLSANSFRQTIAYIFRGVLGTSIAEAIKQKVFNDADRQVDSILRSLGLTSKQSSNKTSSNQGSANVLNTKGMNITVTSGKNTFTIEVGSNFNFKTIGEINSDDLEIVANSTIGMVGFSDNDVDNNYAYNILAHKYQFYSAYSEVGSTVAARFLKDSLFTTNQKQIYQFILVNGKFYPILSIISNICEQTLRFGIIPKQLIEIEETRSRTNSWFGDEGPNWELARARSEMVRKVIDDLKIGLYFNSNVLTRYLPY